MTAKQYLLQYRQALSDLRCKQSERRALFDNATNISPSTAGGTPTPGSVSDKTGRGVVNISALDAQIEAEEIALAIILSEIRETISQVSDSAERNLLTYYYICGYTWEETAAQMHYSYNHVVANLHPKALRKVSAVMKQKGIE